MSSSGKDSGSDTLPSHPRSRRDSDVDADTSLERKRPRLSDDEPPTPGSPVIEVIDDPTSPSQEPVTITSHLSSPSDPSELLCRFPLIHDKLPTAHAAAHCLADEIIKDDDVDYEEMAQLATWLSDARAAIEQDACHFEDSQFWLEVSRIIVGLLQRDSLHKNKFPYDKMGTVLLTLCQETAHICALALEYEAVNFERGVSRRDSVRTGDGTEDAPYKPQLAPLMEALIAVLNPKCELYVELCRRRNLQRLATTTLAWKAFNETSRELETLADLYKKYMANMTALENPYNHIVRLIELSSRLLSIRSPDHSVKLSPVAFERLSTIFDETYFTVYQKMMSIQSRELPDTHTSTLPALQTMVHCLSREHDEFAEKLFTKLVHKASQRTNQGQDSLEEEIGHTRARCRNFPWECTTYLFELDVAFGLIRSGIRDHRITGINLSNNTLLAAWDVARTRKHDGEFGKDPLCQTLALYCLHLNSVGVIFGSDSHADVISQAAPTVNFLLVTNRFTNVEIDKIWTKLLSSSQPDMTQACIGTLGLLTCHFDLNHISHVVGRLADSQVPPTIMWRHWFTEAGKRLLSLSENGVEPSVQLETTKKVVTLLERLFSFAVENLDVVVRELLPFLRTVLSSPESMTNLAEYCVQRIGEGTRAATGPVHALVLCLTSIPDTPSLWKDVSIFDPALSELRAYVSTRTCINPEPAPWSGAELVPRVQLVLWALTTLDEADAITFEETIWGLVVGADAIGHTGRTVGVRAIVQWFAQRRDLSGFGHRCVEKYLPQLPAEYATPGLVDLHILLERGARSPSSVVLNSTLLEQLIRLSLSSPDRDLSAQFEIRVCSWLFGKVAQEHHEEAQQAQAAVTQQCLRALASESVDTKLKALHLLRRLVCDGSAFDGASTTRCSVAKLGTFEVDTSDGEQGHIKVNIEALCPPEPSKQFSLLVAPAMSLHELKAAILHHTGFSQLRVMSLGKTLDLDEPFSIQEAGLTKDNNICALLVQRIWSFEELLNSDILSQSDSAIQQSLLQHHSQLHALLDVGETAEQACMLLKYLPIPVSSRVSVAKLQSLPLENCWKAEYSVHVLQVILRQQISQGIADAKFISQSIRLLVDVLVKDSERVAMQPLKTAVTALLSFLKGKKQIQEQPVQDMSSEYFENPQQFISSVMQILSQLASGKTDDWVQNGPMLSELAEKTFECLLEAMMSCSPIRSALLDDDSFKDRFKSLLRSRNYALASVVSQSLANCCKTTTLQPELTTMFWCCMNDLLADIADDETTARAVSDVALVLLQCNTELLSDQASVRSLVEKIVDLLRKIQPEESFNSSSFDHRVRFLCVLLRFCVVQMKSFKQPLDLGQVALELFRSLLFPEVSTDLGKTTRSIKHVDSRHVVFELIGLLCDDRTTHAALVDASREFHHLAEKALDKDTSLYPGRESYLREERSHVGLKNLGQTCYLNSLLQQLFMNYDFRKFILELDLPENKQDPVLVHFKDLFSALHFSNASYHAPSALAEILGIDVGVQEDAHLFFTMLISRLEDSMPDKETKEKLLFFFGGRNRSQTRGECGHVSESTDDYLNLSLTVKDKINLTESLQEYVAGASLEGGDKFKCTTCEEEDKQPYVNAVRRTGLETIPNTLILGLKRFRYESWDGGTKVNDRFEFPAELDMAPFKLEHLADSSKHIQADKFELIGVIVHQGTLQIGHYWSYAKDHRTYGQQPGSWFRMEDSTVRSCDLDFVLRECMGGDIQLNNGEWRERSDSAYILIYRRLTVSPATIDADKRIVVPEERSKQITASNSVVETKVHLLDIAHTHFIEQLLNQMDTFAADVDRQHEAHAMELGLMHLHRVTAKVDVAGNFKQVVEKTSLRSMHNSRYLLFYVFDNAHVEKFLFGTNQLRQATNGLVLSTLEYLRREDPCVYGQEAHDNVMVAVDQGPLASPKGSPKGSPREGSSGEGSGGRHSRQADDGAVGPDLPGVSEVAVAGLKSDGLVYGIIETLAISLPKIQYHRPCWATYFDLVASIANFGVEETRAVLDFQFLEWCLDVLTLRYHSESSRLNDDVLKSLRKAKPTWVVLLADIVNRLLQHVDLSWSPPVRGSRTRSVSGGECSLNSVEVGFLLRRTEDDVDRSTLLRSICQDLACSQAIKTGIAESWAPCRLTQTLLKANDRTVDFLLESMEFYFERLPGDREGCIAVAMAICLSTAASPHAKHLMLNAVIASVQQDKTAQEALWFFEAITKSEDMGVMIWQSLFPWFEKLLRPSEDFVPEETFKWLCKHMLLKKVFTVPSSEASLAVDVARIRAAVDMHKWIRRICERYMKFRTDIQDMDSMFRTFLGVQQYLSRVFAILWKGIMDRPGVMKDVMLDTDLLELSNEDSDSQNPLVQHGGTITLPHEVEDMIGGCMRLINEGKHFKQQIEDYKQEQRGDSDDEEDYEEDLDDDIEIIDC